MGVASGGSRGIARTIKHMIFLKLCRRICMPQLHVSSVLGTGLFAAVIKAKAVVGGTMCAVKVSGRLWEPSARVPGLGACPGILWEPGDLVGAWESSGSLVM